MFATVYASYVTRMGTYPRNAPIRNPIKEDLNQESTTGKESNLRKDIIFEPQKWMTVLKKKKKLLKNLANLMKKE
jgi:hypothetical protein